MDEFGIKLPEKVDMPLNNKQTFNCVQTNE